MRKLKLLWIGIVCGLICLSGAVVWNAARVNGEHHRLDKSNVTLSAPLTMYRPSLDSPSPGALYARAVRLKYSGSANGTMLATFEKYVQGRPSFPIFRSVDGGKTWKQISSVKDQVNGWGLRYQPFLYELPQRIGDMPKGTLLLAGNSIPGDLSETQIDLYKSTDHGMTWSFVSRIASGGEAKPINGLTPVWEPFLMVANNKLICYYSDQRDPKYGQKLVHQVSTDGIHWGTVVTDVVGPHERDRPGMPVVAKMGNGKYIMTYEFWGAPEGGFAVYYKIAPNPEDFGSVTGVPLKSTDGYVPTSSPYVIWVPSGGVDGTLVVSAASSSDLFINTQYGKPDQWIRLHTTMPAGYSRSLVSMPGGQSLFVISGGQIGAKYNTVTYETIQLHS